MTTGTGPAPEAELAAGAARWRKAAYAVPLALTLVLFTVGAPAARAPITSVPLAVSALVVIGWPFWVLASLVSDRLVRGPAHGGLRWAAAGALLGLSVPYVYAVSAAGGPGLGYGLPVFLGFVAPCAGGLLASIGWLGGLGLWRLARGDSDRRR